MSVKINIDSLSEEVKEKLVKDLTVSPENQTKFKKTFYTPKTPSVELFYIDGDDVVVPFSYAIKELNVKKPKSDSYKKKEVLFVGSLRDTQKSIKDEAISLLNTHGATLIACYPGFGKTITSIYIASKIKLQTLIVVHRIVLISQWKTSIKTFCPDANVVVLSPSSKQIDIESADFFIVNAINMGKFSTSKFLSGIGTVIVDEAHLIMSKVLSQSLRYLFPKYLLGLSATPYRSDGLNVLLDHYFTPHRITRKLFREHIVYKINTGIAPNVEYDRNGKVNWGSLLESQSNNHERNEMILSIVQKNPERTFLILTKRVEQAKYLFQKLKEINEKVAILVESETEFDRECRVLIGTTSKAGVGFDHDKLDALILASDLEEYFIQYLGRVFRRLDITPIVFDLVDDNPILKRHFATRKAVYLESGGRIEKYVN